MQAPLALAWWVVLLARGVLPALALLFLRMQVLPPLHEALGAHLDSRTGAWLHDQLTLACVRRA